MRTADHPKRGDLIQSVVIINPVKYTATRRLLQGLMGLCSESGEAMDILKKHMFQEHDIDAEREHLAKELGDVAWYLALSADALGYALEDILQMNIDKLRSRYPEGFEASRSLYRADDDI